MAHYEDIMQRILSRGGPASQMAAETGIDMATDPLAYAGTVVPPLDYRTAYNPAGGYAEAGRTVPNYASDWARGMNQVAQPFGGMGAGDRVGFPAPRDPQTGEDLGWMNQDERERFYRHQEQFPEGEDLGWMDQSPTGFDYSSLPPLGGDIGNYRTGYPVDAGTPDINQGNDMWWAGAPGYDTEGVSVVPRPTIPTEKQIIDSTVTAPEDERDAAFSRIHNMWAREPGGDYGGYESEWSEGLGVPEEYIDVYMQVPLEAKMFAHENKGDAKVQSDFEEKYGFVLDVDVPLQGGMERSDFLNVRSTGIPTAP